MSGCGCGSTPKFDGISKVYKRALLMVIAINAVMFAVELSAGFMSRSQALKADALDFLGDTLTYSITLAVIGLPLAWRARAALVKGASLALMGLWVMASTIFQSLASTLPHAPTMGAVGFAALVANLSSVLLLVRFRDGDSNVRSVWLCSRNDAIGNLAVMAAALGVFGTGSGWPDLAVAAVMGVLALTAARSVIQQARAELRPVPAHV